jgi:hypothetical protein
MDQKIFLKALKGNCLKYWVCQSMNSEVLSKGGA